jgi:hypothetical protein
MDKVFSINFLAFNINDELIRILIKLKNKGNLINVKIIHIPTCSKTLIQVEYKFHSEILAKETIELLKKDNFDIDRIQYYEE